MHKGKRLKVRLGLTLIVKRGKRIILLSCVVMISLLERNVYAGWKTYIGTGDLYLTSVKQNVADFVLDIMSVRY